MTTLVLWVPLSIPIRYLPAIVRFLPVLADEIAAVDHEHVAVDVVGGAAGQEDGRAHEVGSGSPQRAAGMWSRTRLLVSGSLRVAVVISVA